MTVDCPTASGPFGHLDWHSDSPDEMRSLGKAVGLCLNSTDCIALCGPLGAGKTTFAKGIADGLNLGDVVVSPTYTLVAIHQGGRLPLVHVDLYRIHDDQDLQSIGWDALLDEDGVLVVEWADRACQGLPADHLLVTLTHNGDDSRMLRLKPRGFRAAEIVEQLRDKPSVR